VRPLLPFFRRELEEYAYAVGLVPRQDLSNRDPRWTRNRIRHELLPLAEALVPGGGASLARLAAVMAERTEAWDSMLRAALEELPTTRSPGRIEVARTPFLTYHSAVRTGLLELWIRELGGALGEASIRVALQAASSIPSGRAVSLPGGLLLLREFDLIVLTRPPRPPEDEPLEISPAEQGCGVARIGGSRVSIRWGSRAPDSRCVERFVTSGLRFPLLVRGRRPGDRIRLAGGTRKLKKVLADRRIPLGKRDRQPLLVDAAGVVLWVPGVVRSADAAGEDAGFFVGVGDADRT
jgi:tRNA(Ile)-lysidine synthase